jgi:hypothetical protein
VQLDPRYLEQRFDHRTVVVRRALLLTPAAIAVTALLVIAIQALPSSIVMVVILGISAFAVDMEAIASLRDLRAKPVVTRGRVDRLWDKSRFLFFFGKVNYLLIGRRLFEISTPARMELEPGDEVEVVHWPHSNVVVTVERLAKAPPRPR